MPNDGQTVFTESEYLAVNLLFDAVNRVLGSEEHRIVDPVSRIVHLLDGLDEADGFVRRLEGLGLISLVFVRKDCTDDAAHRPTFRAALDRWVDVVSSAKRVPDPPFKAEERMVREAIERKRRRRQELVERRAALARQLEEAEAAIASAETEIKEAERAASEFAEWRRRIAAITDAA